MKTHDIGGKRRVGFLSIFSLKNKLLHQVDKDYYT